MRQENFENLKEIKDDIRKTNNRIDDTEKLIVETEECTQNLEEATLELMELQKQVETRMEVVKPTENWIERINRWTTSCAKNGHRTTETQQGYKQKLQALRRDRDT